MLSLPPSVRVFVATGPVDLRKSFDTLAGVVRAQFGQEPLDGHIFVFIGRERTSVKVLWWDRTGYAILHKDAARRRRSVAWWISHQNVEIWPMFRCVTVARPQ